jgi:hypothetical protein
VKPPIDRGRDARPGLGWVRRWLGTATRTALVVLLSATGATAAPVVLPPSSITVFHITGSTGAPHVRAWDGFNRTDGGLGSAIVGGVWGSRNGTWTIESNRAKSSNAVASTATVSLPTILNCRIDLDLVLGSTAYAGLDLSDDGTNSILVLYKRTSTVSELELLVLIGGSGPMPTPVATAPVAIGSAASISVTLSGSDVSVLWNGVPTINYRLTAPEVMAVRDSNSIGYGIWAQSDATTRFDNFRVETS